MLIRFVILIFFLKFNIYSNDKNINEKQIKNIIEKYILENPEIIIESLEKFTADVLSVLLSLLQTTFDWSISL